MKTENQKYTPGKWEVVNDHCRPDSPYKIYKSVSIKSDGWFIAEVMGNVGVGGKRPTKQSIANAQLIASAPELKQRVTDMEMVISNFITHVEENRGNYFPEELKKLRDLVAVERPYFPPVTYHDNWSGKETSTEKD